MALGWPGFARRREPAVHNKKTLVSAQNIENKGPKIFLPPRSMVLKIVRGKILETLELAWLLAQRLVTLREILRPAGENAGLQDDGNGSGPVSVEPVRRQRIRAKLSGCQGSEISLQKSSAFLCYRSGGVGARKK